MTKAWILAGALTALGVAVACGSSDGGTAASTSAPEAGAPDATPEASTGPRGTMGAKCDADTDCEDGLECLDAKSGQLVWPAHGVCTMKCDATDVKNPAGEATCRAHTPSSHCTKVGSSQGYCVEPCSVGPPGTGSVASGVPEGKCHGRADMGCQVLLSGQSGCYPTCNNDGNCAPDALCDTFGFCELPPVKGWDQIGRPASQKCEVATGGADSVCTAACTIGVEPSCGWQGPGTKAPAACLRGGAGDGPGDRGECVQLCDCDGECTSGYGCVAISTIVSTELGRAGECVAGATTTLGACGDAGADGG